MRMSLSAEGVACTITRQKDGRFLKIPSAAASQGGSAVGSLNSPAGMVSAARTLACARESLERDSQDGVCARAMATQKRSQQQQNERNLLIMSCPASEEREYTKNSRAPT